MEPTWLEFIPIIVDEEFPAYLELKCVFAEGLHPYEQDQRHAEKTTHVSKGSIETRVRAIVLQDEVWFPEKDSNELISVDDLEVADNWSFVQANSLLSGDISHWLRKDAFVGIDLILREEDVATDAYHISELEVRSILQHII